jgi:hypothetical protein
MAKKPTQISSSITSPAILVSALPAAPAARPS